MKPKFLKRCFVISIIITLVTGFNFISIPTVQASGTTYYVDNCVVTGNDSNNGTSPSTPWLTINQVNNFSSFHPGDSILFEKGCTWREQLTVPSSGSAGNPITFGAYGSGGMPIISGANVLTGFSVYTPAVTWAHANGMAPGIGSTPYALSLGYTPAGGSLLVVGCMNFT